MFGRNPSGGSDPASGKVTGDSRNLVKGWQRSVMKLAIVGKGGAGKTTLAALLARRAVSQGHSVVAVDADPDGNLASALGTPPDALPQPIAGMRDLILERTDARAAGGGWLFRLNPRVDDLPERFSVMCRGVRLLVLGTVEGGGAGCLCPAATVLKALMQHLLLQVEDDVILDMEAGLEHVGRASARGVDAMLAVVEPGLRSVQTAIRIKGLAEQIGIQRVLVAANQIRARREEVLLREAMPGLTFLGALPFSPGLARADLEGRAVEEAEPALAEAVARVAEALKEHLAEKIPAAGG